MEDFRIAVVHMTWLENQNYQFSIGFSRSIQTWATRPDLTVPSTTASVKR